MEKATNGSFTAQIRPAVVAMVLLTLITGVLYPLCVTVVAQIAFPWQANGSFVQADGSRADRSRADGSSDGGDKVAGSALIGIDLLSSGDGAGAAAVLRAEFEQLSTDDDGGISPRRAAGT